jgi:hypothetical protein
VGSDTRFHHRDDTNDATYGDTHAYATRKRGRFGARTRATHERRRIQRTVDAASNTGVTAQQFHAGILGATATGHNFDVGAGHHHREHAGATCTRCGDAYTSIDNVDRCKPIRARHGMGKRNDGREGRLHPRPAIGNLADGRFKL